MGDELADLLGSVKAPKPVEDWYRVLMVATGDDKPTKAKVNIYDAIGGWYFSARDFVTELDALDVDEIEVHLNSPGGSVWDGIAIMNSLKAHRARVTVVVDGIAASIATVIAMAGDEVVMAEGSQMMVHRSSGLCWGNAPDMQEMQDFLAKTDATIASIYARRTDGTAAEWLDRMDAETWMTAQEAVDFGLAHRVDGEAPADVEDRFDLSIFNFAGRSHAPAPTAAKRTSAVASATLRIMPTNALKTPASSEPGNTIRKESAMSDTLKAGIMQRLGVTDAALDEDGILAALDEALAEQEQPTNQTPPEGVVMVDKTVWEQTQNDAAAGRQAFEAQASARRDQIVDRAIAEGRITAASSDKYRALLDVDESATVNLLDTLATNTVPVAPKGYTGGINEASDEDVLYSKLYTKEA